MDDVGGTIKNVIFHKVKSGQIVVHTPKDFSDAAMKFVPSIIINSDEYYIILLTASLTTMNMLSLKIGLITWNY